MALDFSVPDDKKIRVIIDTDAACEADDPFAIVHALLSPRLIVRGILAAHFAEEGSMMKSLREIQTILEAMKLSVPVYRGQEKGLAEDTAPSEGVRFIRDEAMRTDGHPLFLLCQGAVTNAAMALKLYPEIKDRIHVIWIGTHGAAPAKAPFREFNAGNDIEAANYVLSSGVSIWVVPSGVYGSVQIGIAEIQRRIRPCGAIGEHLFRQLADYNMSEYAGWTQGESWSLGDSPAPALAVNPGCGRYVEVPAPHIGDDTSSEEAVENPVIRMYTGVDTRYILEDLIAKLELNYRE